MYIYIYNTYIHIYIYLQLISNVAVLKGYIHIPSYLHVSNLHVYFYIYEKYGNFEYFQAF